LRTICSNPYYPEIVREVKFLEKKYGYFCYERAMVDSYIKDKLSDLPCESQLEVYEPSKNFVGQVFTLADHLRENILKYERICDNSDDDYSRLVKAWVKDMREN
jgi:hypothetical protein